MPKRSRTTMEQSILCQDSPFTLKNQACPFPFVPILQKENLKLCIYMLK
jgi:hypothetical protein